MFRQSLDEVRNRLMDMVQVLEEILKDRTNGVMLAIQRDYNSVMGTRDIPNEDRQLHIESPIRKEILRIIEYAEPLFQGIALGGTPDTKDKPEVADKMSPEAKDLNAHIDPPMVGKTVSVPPTEITKHTPIISPILNEDYRTLKGMSTDATDHEASSPLSRHEAERFAERETPDALDAQLQTA